MKPHTHSLQASCGDGEHELLCAIIIAAGGPARRGRSPAKVPLQQEPTLDSTLIREPRTLDSKALSTMTAWRFMVLINQL